MKTVTVSVSLRGADDEDTELLNRQLREDLAAAVGLDARTRLIETPQHSKSGFSTDIATILVAAVASGGALTTLINVISSRLTRERTVTVELDGDKLILTGVGSEEQNRLISGWLARHKASQATPRA